MMYSVSSAPLLLFFAAAVASQAADGPGAVYTITNSPAGNSVVVYNRAGNGDLTPGGVFASGGVGTGAGLGSQGAVIASADQRFLFAVNAGSNSITSFRIRPDGLEMVNTVGSGGLMPTSLTFNQGILYVLNAGVPNNISGFSVNRSGRITPLAGSTRPLSADATSPAQVGFSDDGDFLVVSERATNNLDVYSIDRDGYATGPFVQPSAGPTPFGFAIDKRNTLFVSEAGAGGGASTYRITETPGLQPVSSGVMTGQRAACWAVVTGNGRFGYVTNAGTGNISGFAIGHDGSASLLDADGITAQTGGNPTDAILSHDSKFLYVRVAALNQIAVFRVRSDGSLTALQPLTGTPTGLAGLAGF
ncbi:MAG: beta-propeller fold lactonase family protein [Bryobacterales bacterium]|nr:beta-propeller fold lactonase family protein [Bryobacterales bacterium]